MADARNAWPRYQVLDSFGQVASGRKASYNPLSGLQPGSTTMIEDANLIADAIVVRGTGSKDPNDPAFGVIHDETGPMPGDG